MTKPSWPKLTAPGRGVHRYSNSGRRQLLPSAHQCPNLRFGPHRAKPERFRIGRFRCACFNGLQLQSTSDSRLQL